MKTASFIGVILLQEPLHLAHILGSYLIGVILTQARLHLTQILWRYPIGWRTNQTKPTTTWINQDLRVLSRKHISHELRVFGVTFWNQIFICVKKLTFRNSEPEVKPSWKTAPERFKSDKSKRAEGVRYMGMVLQLIGNIPTKDLNLNCHPILWKLMSQWWHPKPPNATGIGDPDCPGCCWDTGQMRQKKGERSNQ